MKSLVIYDSNQGNTQKIAEEIGAKLNAQVINIAQFAKDNRKDVDLLIVGSPIIGWKPTEKMEAFLASLDKNSLKGIKATAFDTRVKLFIHGDAKEKIAKALKNLGAEIFTPSMPFYVLGKDGPLLDGEIEKAQKWAEEIADKFTKC